MIGSLIALLLSPTYGFAQHGGGTGSGSMGGSGMHGGMQQGTGPGHQHMMGQGMADNMSMMSDMMNEMHQMMAEGQMTQEHQRQMMDMMNDMGKMMQQTAGPKGRSMDEQHNHQLQEMEKRLDTMRNQIGK